RLNTVSTVAASIAAGAQPTRSKATAPLAAGARSRIAATTPRSRRSITASTLLQRWLRKRSESISGTGLTAQKAISASRSEDASEDVVDMLEVIAEIEALGERRW